MRGYFREGKSLLTVFPSPQNPSQTLSIQQARQIPTMPNTENCENTHLTPWGPAHLKFPASHQPRPVAQAYQASGGAAFGSAFVKRRKLKPKQLVHSALKKKISIENKWRVNQYQAKLRVCIH